MRQRNGGTDSRHRLSNMDSQVVLSIHVHLFFKRVEKTMECSVCCPQLSFQLAELRRKQASPTVQDLLKLNKVIRAAKVIESKIKIRSIPVEHFRFLGVHDAAHANLEGGASQQGHLILAVHASITDCRVPASVLSWQNKKIKRVVRSSLAAETCSMSTCQEHLDWMRTMWEQMTRGDFCA